MAKFQSELPTEIIKDFEKIYGDADEILGAMTKAGAEAVADKVRATCPTELKPYVKISRTYKTPSDNGINTKVYISGYLPFSNPNREYFLRRAKAGGTVYSTTKGVPTDFLANLYEYGRSSAPWKKKPFLRKAFNYREFIEQKMLEAQKQKSGGLLDDE